MVSYRDKREVQIDPGLQERLLLQMREEQEAAMRRRALQTWILGPLALGLIAIGTVLSFSDDMTVAIVANVIASTLLWALWKINKARIRRALGLSE